MEERGHYDSSNPTKSTTNKIETIPKNIFFNEVYLPSKDLLSRRSCRISLRVQGDDYVGAKLFSLKNLLGNLFRDFGRDRVMALHLEEKVKVKDENDP